MDGSHHYCATDTRRELDSTVFKRRLCCWRPAQDLHCVSVPYFDNLASPWDQEDSAALGHRTNNLGELWAIGMAMQIAARRISIHPHAYDQFRIFSDSQFSIGILTQGWKSRTHPELALKLRHLFNNFPIYIEWVPAHVGIDSNERADPGHRRARGQLRGAKNSAKSGADANASSATSKGATSSQ